MRSRFAQLTALIVPPRCMVCACACQADGQVCPDCRRELRRADHGRPRRLARSRLDTLHAAYEYEGAARAAVHSLKFSGRTALAELMGQLLLDRLPPSIDMTNFTIIPVPSHPANRRRRGFDQAALLARAMASAAGVRYVDCLVRHGLRGTQTGLGRVDRLAVPAGEFTLREPASRHRAADPLADFPTNVVVCDDVTTTTCTLEACASAIRERCNVQTIRGLAFASASTVHSELSASL